MGGHPILHLEGREISMKESETGRFGITKNELKRIAYKQLCATGNGRRKPQALLDLVLKFMNIRTHGKPKEEMMKVFIAILREMRDEGRVEFKSGQTAMFVVLK
jgi:hypothetical protein